MNYSKALLPLGIATLLLAGCGGGGGHGSNSGGGNNSPAAIADSLSTQAETSYSGSVRGYDSDRNDKLTFAVATAPLHGTLDLKPGGGFTYTPSSEYVGKDSFTFTANDGKATSTAATVDITVNNLQVSFNDYSRKAFNQAGTDKPLPLNSRSVTQDVTDPKAYDDLIAR